MDVGQIATGLVSGAGSVAMLWYFISKYLPRRDKEDREERHDAQVRFEAAIERQGAIYERSLEAINTEARANRATFESTAVTLAGELRSAVTDLRAAVGELQRDTHHVAGPRREQ